MTGLATKFLYTLALVVVVLLPVFASCANTPPVHTQALGEYLKDLFQSNEIVLDESDFLGPVEEPFKGGQLKCLW